jgi:murein tripeptide amidase MpaA
MKLTLLTTLLTASLAAAAPPPVQKVSYDGYKVYRVKTNGHADTIEAKLASVEHQTWNTNTGSHLDILVAPGQVGAFEALGLAHSVMHGDLGASISAEAPRPEARLKCRADDEAWFDDYHNYEDHIQYFRDLQALFPNNSERFEAGQSYQKRSIFGLHLWGRDGPGKPAILYHGTVHAREWIAAPVVEYITRQLILGYNAGDEEVQSFLDKYDFYVIPIVNPDGFVYSQVADRLWRKNRQPGPAGSTCVGRDINRNWEFGWDANPLGASTNPCSQTYKGARPADSPENAALDAFARKLRDGAGIKLYIDWHSYGQYILSPFGYKETLYAPELGKWTKASSILSEVIRDSSERRTTFTFGPSGATLYTTTGAAPDHMYSIGRADWSFTIELPDTGDNGFVLPPEAIRGAAEEQWEGQKVLYSLLDETFFDGRGPAALYTGQ